MSEKIERLGIERDPAFLYFVRRGEVWRVARPGDDPAGALRPPELVVETAARSDARFVYFVDRDGDLARVRRSASSPKRYKKRAVRARASA